MMSSRSPPSLSSPVFNVYAFCFSENESRFILQILSDITGNMDARKVCKDALKIHKKYLSKVCFILSYTFICVHIYLPNSLRKYLDIVLKIFKGKGKGKGKWLSYMEQHIT